MGLEQVTLLYIVPDVALTNMNDRWIGVRTDVLGGVFSGVIGAYLVYGNHKIAAGNTGFALNQILVFSFHLLGLVRKVPFYSTASMANTLLIQGVQHVRSAS